jgi:hypothetical protein
MAIAILAVSSTDAFVSGAFIGTLVGVLAGPVMRAWLTSRERSASSDEASDIVLTDVRPFEDVDGRAR